MKPTTVRKLMHDIENRKRKCQQEIIEAKRRETTTAQDKRSIEATIKTYATKVETYEEMERLIMAYRNGEKHEPE